MKGFLSLRVLDVSYCQLDEWSQVVAFGSLPSLREVIADGNPISKITSTDDSLRQLVRFSLSGLKIASWSDINALSAYPQLSVLRLSQIPLFNGKGASEVRPIVIGRLKNLEVFNGSKVSQRERFNAEKLYFRQILKDIREEQKEKREKETVDEPASVENNAALLAHPRYRELYDIYHDEVDAASSTNERTDQSKISSELINIVFKNLSFRSNGTLEPIQKKLPRSIAVGKVRIQVNQLFGLDPRLQQLSLRVYKDAVPTLLDDDESSLQYYGAVDNAEIFINEDKD